jgi:hypothetical protein
MRTPFRSVLFLVCLGAFTVPPVAAQTATFDLDNGTPTLYTGQSVPFIQTVGGVTATFSSPQGAAFSLQTDGTTFFRLSQFSGHYLMPNDINRNALHIVFDQPLASITLNFATIDYQDNAEIPGDLNLSAYDSTTGTLVGTTSTHGTYLGDTYPMGTISFSTATQHFDTVDLVVPYQPQGTTGFLADNFTVTAALVAPLEVSPPDAVQPLMFTTQEEFIWDDAAASHAASFNLYRGDMSEMQNGTFGSCLAAGVGSSYYMDIATPLEGTGFFYLVTACNALGEGTMGLTSAGIERANLTPCP